MAARSIELVHGTPVYRLRGNLLPLVYLREVLELAGGAGAGGGAVNIVVLQADDRHFGLVVDRINDSEEIVVKPLGKQLKGISAFAGATIMGDGRVALILDVLGLAQRSKVVSERREQTVIEDHEASKRAAVEDRQTLLLFRAGEDDRLCVPLGLVARLEEFPRSKLERAGSEEVVQYRSQIMRLVRLAGVLGTPAPPDRDPVQVIVFSEGSRRIGLVVDAIIDIVEDRVEVKSESRRSGVLGSAVIGGQVTELVDVQEVIAAGDPLWLSNAAGERAGVGQGRQRSRLVLLVEDSAFFRGVLRAQLEMAGYTVIEAADGVEALEKLGERAVDVVLTDIEMPRMDGFELARRMRQDERLARVPVMAVTALGRPEIEERQKGAEAGFADLQFKFDREGMLAAIQKLAVAVDQGKQETEVHV